MVAFKQAQLQGLTIANPASLQFGPDGRLYIAQNDGSLVVANVTGDGVGGYSVASKEVINLVKAMPNHNDDGTFNAAITSRQVTGVLVAGTADEPVVYVSSSDPRIGGGSSKGDTGLDTNSGTLSRLTKDSTGAWVKVDLVIGLPRSEENHAVNGLQFNPENGHILLTVGGNTNVGAPSQEFGYLSEYAYSSSIVDIDVVAIDALPNQTYRGQVYKLALPTVNDPTRSAAGDVVATGQPEIYGGNDGLNQARLTSDSPVQIYATGFRNIYDIAVTEAGKVYGIDNSGNPTWGGPPMYRQADGSISTAPTADVVNAPNDGSGSINKAPLHWIEEGYYGGHATPIRANPNGAALYNDNGTIVTNLPSDWPPVPSSMANPIEGYYLPPEISRADRLPASLETPLNLRDELMTFPGSVNGIDDYRANAFNGELKGDLIAASLNDDYIYRIDLSPDGQTVLGRTNLTPNGVLGGGSALDVHAAPENGPFAGTLWVASYGGGITVLTPDEGGTGGPVSNDADSDGLNNTIDPFAVDATNGAAVTVQGGSTLTWSFSQNEPHPGPGGIGNLGFTGVMLNGTTAYTAQYDPNKTIMGGAAAGVLIQDIGPGTPLANNQTDAYQFGIRIGSDVETFIVKGKVNNPFDGTTPADNQSVGFFIGTGDQANYIRLVAGSATVNGVANTPSIDILVENNNSVVVRQTIQVPVFGMGQKAITASDSIVLTLLVDPNNGVVTPGWTVSRGSTASSSGDLFTGQGNPIHVSGELLKTLQGTHVLPGTNGQSVSSGLAVGLIGTSDGLGAPFSATFNSIDIVSTAKPSLGTGVAELIVTPSGMIDVSTFDANTVRLKNLSESGSDLKQVVIDLNNAVLPDGVFFDPTGAGGNNGRGFTVNTKLGAFDATASYSDGSSSTGYRKLTLDLTGFNPGEELGFSIDIDPDSMIGYPHSVTPGAISGAELAGSRVTFVFADGTTTQGHLFGSGVAQAEARGFTTLRAAPTVSLQGVSSGDVAFPAGDPSIAISGTPGASVRVEMLVVEAQLVEFSSPFEGNNATNVVYETVVLDDAGHGFVSADLIDGRVLVVAAAEVNTAGRALSAVSQELRVVHSNDAPPAPGTILGTDSSEVLTGTSGNDVMDAKAGADRVIGGGGNDTIDAGAGVDTLALSGSRGSYGFDLDGLTLKVQDLRPGSPDGSDAVVNAEQVDFLGGFVKPVGTIVSGLANETLQGTSSADVFLFDTAIGLGLGIDGIKNFAGGDRLVTTSAIYDSNNDGRISANSSDRFILPGTLGSGAVESTGTLRLSTTTGSVVSSIKFLGTESRDGVVFYAYAAVSDTSTGTGLNFGSAPAAPTVAISIAASALSDNSTGTTATFAFSTSPIGFALDDITMVGGAVSNLQQVSGNALAYTATFTATDGFSGQGSLTVAAGRFTDATSTANVAANPAIVSIDRLNPTLAITSSDASLTTGETATLTLTFSEVPAGLVKSDIVVESGTLGTLNTTSDAKVFTIDYAPASGVQDSSMAINVTADAYTDQAGNNGAAAILNISVVTDSGEAPAYNGTSGADTFIATTAQNWTISGLAGNDRLGGAAGNDRIDGGADVDTLLLTGRRGDYAISVVEGVLTVHDRRTGAPDGIDAVFGFEGIEFAGGGNKPVGVIEGSYLSETLFGTTAADTFLFDTALGLSLGADQIKSFGAGDRLVTTSAIYDSNNDGRITANSSDRFTLPATDGGLSNDTTGSLKLFSPNGKAISSVRLIDTEVHDGVSFYVYSAFGDTTLSGDLAF